MGGARSICLGETVTRGGESGNGMDREEDHRLIEAVAQGDREAFATLYDRHRSCAHQLACFLTRDSDMADEAVQNAMVRIWTGGGASSTALTCLAATTRSFSAWATAYGPRRAGSTS